MNKFFRRFRAAQSGVAAIEFALMVPMMLFTFFGVAEISSYILASRKVANVASIAADLVAQDKSVDDAEMSDIMGALDVVIRPFNPANARIIISSVVADDDGNLTIAWSDARHTAPRAAGSAAPAIVPAGIVPNNQGIVMAEIEFTYTSTFGQYLTSGSTVSDVFFLKPRRSTTVQRE
jgi:Flp pilus assembly protein TadG